MVTLRTVGLILAIQLLASSTSTLHPIGSFSSALNRLLGAIPSLLFSSTTESSESSMPSRPQPATAQPTPAQQASPSPATASAGTTTDQNHSSDSESTGEICVICQDHFSRNDQITLTIANETCRCTNPQPYHQECFSDLINHQPRCPVCRNEMSFEVTIQTSYGEFKAQKNLLQVNALDNRQTTTAAAITAPASSGASTRAATGTQAIPRIPYHLPTDTLPTNPSEPLSPLQAFIQINHNLYTQLEALELHARSRFSNLDLIQIELKRYEQLFLHHCSQAQSLTQTLTPHDPIAYFITMSIQRIKIKGDQVERTLNEIKQNNILHQKQMNHALQQAYFEGQQSALHHQQLLALEQFINQNRPKCGICSGQCAINQPIALLTHQQCSQIGFNEAPRTYHAPCFQAMQKIAPGSCPFCRQAPLKSAPFIAQTTTEVIPTVKINYQISPN